MPSQWSRTHFDLLKVDMEMLLLRVYFVIFPHPLSTLDFSLNTEEYHMHILILTQPKHLSSVHSPSHPMSSPPWWKQLLLGHSKACGCIHHNYDLPFKWWTRREDPEALVQESTSPVTPHQEKMHPRKGSHGSPDSHIGPGALGGALEVLAPPAYALCPQEQPALGGPHQASEP